MKTKLPNLFRSGVQIRFSFVAFFLSVGFSSMCFAQVTNKVLISTNAGFRAIQANGWPDHAPGQFPNRGNPNSLASQTYNFRMTLKPQTNAAPRDGRGAWFGVALNGVPFEPGTGEFWNGDRQWNFEAKGGFINLGLDQHNAHVQPNGSYHYHGLPTGLLQKRGDDGRTPLLVGWAADGFSIYGESCHAKPNDAKSPLKKMRSSWRLKQGERAGGPRGKYDGRFTADYEFVKGSGDLDDCNGHFGVTPDFPQGVYHYHITQEFPYVSRFWRGTPDASFDKPRPGPGNPRPGQRRPGPPPEPIRR